MSIDERGSFYLGQRYDLATGKTRVRAAALRQQGSHDARRLRRHDRQRQDGAVHLAVGRSGARRHPRHRDRSEGRPGQPAAGVSESRAERLSAVDRRERSGPASKCRPTSSPPSQAELWRNGLAKWDRRPGAHSPLLRCGRPRDLHAGLQRRHSDHRAEVVSRAPPQELVADADAFSERIASATSGLLALLGHRCRPGPQPRAHLSLERARRRLARRARTSICGN